MEKSSAIKEMISFIKEKNEEYKGSVVDLVPSILDKCFTELLNPNNIEQIYGYKRIIIAFSIDDIKRNKIFAWDIIGLREDQTLEDGLIERGIGTKYELISLNDDKNKNKKIDDVIKIIYNEMKNNGIEECYVKGNRFYIGIDIHRDCDKMGRSFDLIRAISISVDKFENTITKTYDSIIKDCKARLEDLYNHGEWAIVYGYRIIGFLYDIESLKQGKCSFKGFCNLKKDEKYKDNYCAELIKDIDSSEYDYMDFSLRVIIKLLKEAGIDAFYIVDDCNLMITINLNKR